MAGEAGLGPAVPEGEQWLGMGRASLQQCDAALAAEDLVLFFDLVAERGTLLEELDLYKHPSEIDPNWQDTNNMIGPLMDNWLLFAEFVISLGCYPGFPPLAESVAGPPAPEPAAPSGPAGGASSRAATPGGGFSP